MADDGPDACLGEILALPGDDRWEIDRDRIVRNQTAYVVRSFDGNALIFAIPLLISRPLLLEIPLDSRGAPGAVSFVIERIKERAASDANLGPLVGKGTRFPHQFASFTEPYTIVTSTASLASDLWHTGDRNFADPTGIHLLLNGAVPCPPVFSRSEVAQVTEAAARLCDAISRIACSIPVRELEAAWIQTLDQELLRVSLPESGLVSFVGDGSRLPRH